MPGRVSTVLTGELLAQHRRPVDARRLFSPRGASPPRHSHPQDESYIVVDGQLTVQAGEQLFALGPDDGGTLAVNISEDVTETKPPSARSLSEASAVVGSSLDYEQTLRRVAALIMPPLADWCALDRSFNEGDLAFAQALATPRGSRRPQRPALPGPTLDQPLRRSRRGRSRQIAVQHQAGSPSCR